jgi:uncharacterized protein YjiS (DUF1127 family)
MNAWLCRELGPYLADAKYYYCSAATVASPAGRLAGDHSRNRSTLSMQPQKLTVTQGSESAPVGTGFGPTSALANRQSVERRAQEIRAAVIGNWIGSGLAKLVAVMRTARRRRIAMAELSALDNRMLADIGISRSEIRGVVSGATGFMPRALGKSTAVPSYNDDVLGRVA